MRKTMIGVGLLALGFATAYLIYWNTFYYSVLRRDVQPSANPADNLRIIDDRLEDKNPNFDPQLVDPQDYDGWQLNKSAAVIRLDCPDIQPDIEPEMDILYASYTDAIEAAQSRNFQLIPSANMLDGIAKQFDDGLYAALDLAYFEGIAGESPSAVDFIKSLFAALPRESGARPFLAAALHFADQSVELTDSDQRASERWIEEFAADQSRSQPISFYTWNDDLRRVWKFYRFLQHTFVQEDLAIPISLAAVLESDPSLKTVYQQLLSFYAGLTNPFLCLNLSDLEGESTNLTTLRKQLDRQQSVVSILPPSSSRENELFDRLFATRSASETNFMIAILKQIRSGTVDLAPRRDSGWYDRQVYALEPLILPERGDESQKLMHTAKYKRRLLQAFQALITKRRETHARQMMLASDSAVAMPTEGAIRPRLRIEPNATFYLRTARSYAFLESFLLDHVRGETLEQLHGLREKGPRELNLKTELAQIKHLFYGFYLITCEDIGMVPNLTEAETANLADAYYRAENWLTNFKHEDLAVDTRVSVPIMNVVTDNSTRLWSTLGVRLVKLNARFERAPKMRETPEAEWQDVEPYYLSDTDYIIPVDEFSELRLPAGQVLTRKQLRSLCDRHKTKAAITKALSP
ncbi:MAG: hypothetical protein P8N76_11825 [Pirellulaceae bacterium]|nr:hypothetical protein [Pirellulaceae bacterium]